MLSESEKLIRELIETNLTGNLQVEIRLYHHSVVRKLEAVDLFYNNVEEITLNNLVFGTATSSSIGTPQNVYIERVDLETIISKISANIDAFFMSAKSTLDTFVHELRAIYNFGGHTGDIYFNREAIVLLRTHHSSTELYLYLNSLNLQTLTWYNELNGYRHASAHESITPFSPSFDFDVLSGRWKEPILKLPLNPHTIPPTFNSKNFKEVGKQIRDELFSLIINCYEKIKTDIELNRTVITI